MDWDEINISINNKSTYMMNFAIGSSPVKIKDKPRMINFSENPEAAMVDMEMKCFTLLERIRWSKRTPRQILRYRVDQVVRYLRMSNPDKIKEYKGVIVQYINEYIFEIITKLMNDPKIMIINLVKELGLTTIIRNLKSTYQLQMILLRTKREFKNRKYLSKVIQDKLSEAYRNFFNEFLSSLEIRYLPESKRGILSDSTTVSEQNNLKDPSQLNRLASFSETSQKVEDAICDTIDSDSGDCSKVINILETIDSKDKISDNLLEDPELTNLVNKVIESKTPDTKNALNDYLLTTVEFSKELKTPCFNIYWEDISENNEEPLVDNKSNSETSESTESDELSILDVIPDSKLLVNDPNYKVGTTKYFGSIVGFIANKVNKNFSIKYYKINGTNLLNFSNWSKIPFKSSTVSTSR